MSRLAIVLLSGTNPPLNPKLCHGYQLDLPTLARAAAFHGHPYMPGFPLSNPPRLVRAHFGAHRAELRRYLDFHGPRLLVRPPSQTLACATDRVGFSYHLGMYLAAFFAEKCLGAPWTLHVLEYREQLAQWFKIEPAGNGPDLIAVTRRGRYHVIEAKGKGLDSPSIRRSILAQARGQKGRLVYLRGAVHPLSSVASGAFVNKGGEVSVEWADPPEPAGPTQLSVEAFSRVIAAHHARITHFLLGSDLESGVIQGRPFALATLPEADMTIGLDAALFTSLVSAHPDADEIVRVARNLPTSSSGPTWSVGGDGLSIQLGASWLDGDEPRLLTEERR